MKKKILILEDYEEMQVLYTAIFKKESSIEIISQVPDAEEAIEAIKQQKPDLIISDITLPGMSGLEFTRLVRQHCPGIKIIIITGFDVDQYKDEAFEAGADEIMLKDDTGSIVNTVKKLLQI